MVPGRLMTPSANPLSKEKKLGKSEGLINLVLLSKEIEYLVGGVSSTLIFSRRHSTSDDLIGLSSRFLQSSDEKKPLSKLIKPLGLITIVFVQDSDDSPQWQSQEAQQNIYEIAICLHIKNFSLLLVYNGFQGVMRPSVKAQDEVRDAFSMLRACTRKQNELIIRIKGQKSIFIVKCWLFSQTSSRPTTSSSSSTLDNGILRLLRTESPVAEDNGVTVKSSVTIYIINWWDIYCALHRKMYLVGGVSSMLIFSRRHSTSDDLIGLRSRFLQSSDEKKPLSKLRKPLGIITIVFFQDSNNSTQWQRQEAQQNICEIAIGLHIKNLSLLLVYYGFQGTSRHWPQCSCFTNFLNDGPKRPLVSAELEARDAFKMLRAYITSSNPMLSSNSSTSDNGIPSRSKIERLEVTHNGVTLKETNNQYSQEIQCFQQNEVQEILLRIKTRLIISERHTPHLGPFGVRNTKFHKNSQDGPHHIRRHTHFITDYKGSIFHNGILRLLRIEKPEKEDKGVTVKSSVTIYILLDQINWQETYLALHRNMVHRSLTSLNPKVTLLSSIPTVSIMPKLRRICIAELITLGNT
ncbi:phosphoglucosamine mutase [Striga asiatica]|uniref:Phosphoglucosamine mutase n=1 Tax=Striga asiatica TaxID=4170 RepID=A0A5A7QCW5_STRAF|nr:phosphoglucosamine mutase [Striga asiatica]